MRVFTALILIALGGAACLPRSWLAEAPVPEPPASFLHRDDGSGWEVTPGTGPATLTVRAGGLRVEKEPGGTRRSVQVEKSFGTGDPATLTHLFLVTEAIEGRATVKVAVDPAPGTEPDVQNFQAALGSLNAPGAYLFPLNWGMPIPPGKITLSFSVHSEKAKLEFSGTRWLNAAAAGPAWVPTAETAEQRQPEIRLLQSEAVAAAVAELPRPSCSHWAADVREFGGGYWEVFSVSPEGETPLFRATKAGAFAGPLAPLPESVTHLGLRSGKKLALALAALICPEPDPTSPATKAPQ